jgi:septal ring factor EnvC (AmiA/AmiB activator)
MKFHDRALPNFMIFSNICFSRLLTFAHFRQSSLNMHSAHSRSNASVVHDHLRVQPLIDDDLHDAYQLRSPSMSRHADEYSARELELRRKNEAIEARQAEVLKRTEELKRQKAEQLSRIPAGSRPPSTRLDRVLANATDSALRFSSEDPLATGSPRHHAAASAASPHGRPASAVVQRTAPSPAHANRPVSSKPAAQTAAALVAAAAAPAPTDADFEMEVDVLGPRMGTEARIRFQAARLKGMQDEIQKLITELNEKDKSHESMASNIKAVEDENKRLVRRLQEMESANEKLKRSASEAVSRAAALEAETIAAKKEVDSQDKARKQIETEKRARDLRLNRALEEADKLRAQLKEQKESTSGGSDALKHECARLDSEVKKLTRQKAEILNAFKKQMKLVDILKRQKMHIEAARLLAFTEEEFTKALEIQV